MSEGLSEIELFREFLNDQIAHGVTDLSPEESLAQFRMSQRAQEEDTEAIKKALARVDAGNPGRPLEEFAEEFRTKHRIPRDV